MSTEALESELQAMRRALAEISPEESAKETRTDREIRLWREECERKEAEGKDPSLLSQQKRMQYSG